MKPQKRHITICALFVSPRLASPRRYVRPTEYLVLLNPKVVRTSRAAARKKRGRNKKAIPSSQAIRLSASIGQWRDISSLSRQLFRHFCLFSAVRGPPTKAVQCPNPCRVEIGKTYPNKTPVKSLSGCIWPPHILQGMERCVSHSSTFGLTCIYACGTLRAINLASRDGWNNTHSF
ncbi:hypothetical protein F4776DRAFT_190513 [Hypoxylon sp. NC0597]|nr:hypothetical protein F4776DRAFT_190513 [Hypoxylon sp. NC0597]